MEKPTLTSVKSFLKGMADSNWLSKVCFFVVLRLEPGASHMLGKRSTIWAMPHTEPGMH